MKKKQLFTIVCVTGTLTSLVPIKGKNRARKIKSNTNREPEK